MKQTQLFRAYNLGREAKLLSGFPVSSCAFYRSVHLNGVRVGLFVCLAALGLSCSMQGLCCVTRDFSLWCMESLAVASGLSSLLHVGSCSLTKDQNHVPA